MSNFRYVFFAGTIFLTVPAFAMDKQDKSINKIIDIGGIQAVKILGNDQVIILNAFNRPQKSRQSFLKVIDLSSDAHPIDLHPEGHCCRFNPILFSDSSKTKALCIGGIDRYCSIFVYDSQTKKHVTPMIPACVMNSRTLNFGALPHTVVFQGGINPVHLYNYDDDTVVLEENITDALVKNEKIWIQQFLPMNKMILSRDNDGAVGIYLYNLTNHEIECLSKRRATDVEYSSDESFIAFQHGPVHLMDCPHMEYNKEYIYSCDCSNCYIVHMHNKQCIPLGNDNSHRCSIAIHPHNKYVATLSGIDNLIQYWCAKTGKCVAQQQSPTPVIDKLKRIPEEYSFRDRISFSADGTMLAVAFPTKCVIFNTPFEVHFGPEANKNIFVWWFLKHYEDGLLPNELMQLLIQKTRDVCGSIK